MTIKLPNFPPFIPKPPLPGEPPFEVDEEEDEKEEDIDNLDNEFRISLRTEGYDPELVEMGLKVMKNHMRPKEEAFRIGKEYIRSMSK